MIKYQLFEQYREIAHFCTSRYGGVSVGNYASWNSSPFTGDNEADVIRNQEILCQRLGIHYSQLIFPFQTHGTEIREINEAFFQLSSNKKTEYLKGVDAIFTHWPNVCIGITTADCVPLLFFDPIKKVIAAAHAGWRGTCGRIGEKTVLAMIERFNCNPADILVTIGPSISVEVYEVGAEVLENFKLAGFEMSEIVEIRENVSFLNLWKANQQSLKNVGIHPKNIEIAGICTFTEHEKFFSARRLGIKSGRMLSGIMLTEK